MEKAYDYKALAANLKAKGLIEAEDMAEVIVKEVMAWLMESALKSETPYDNMLAAAYPMLEEQLLKQVDKIDGQEGEEPAAE